METDLGSNHELNSALQKVLESSSDMVMLIDSDGMIIRLNKAVWDILGYQPEDLVNRYYYDFLWTESYIATEQERQNIMSGRKVEDFENSFRHKNGQRVYISWSAYWSAPDQMMYCIGRNISERRLNEEKIRESEKKYHALFEQSSDAVMITDFEGQFQDINSSLCKMFGYTRDELLQMNIRELLEPAELQNRPIRFDRLREGEHMFNNRNMVHKSGRIIPVEANVKKLDDNSIVAIASDVSKLREVELKMKDDEALFRGVFENSPLGISLISIEGMWLMMNQSLCDILGYSKEELMQINFRDISHPDDIEVNNLAQQQLLDGSIALYKTHKRYLRKDKNPIWVSLNILLQKDNSGKPLYFITQMENINQYKLMEEKLIETDEQLKLFVLHSPAALAMLDKDMNYIVNSKRWNIDYDLGTEDLTGKNHYEVFPEIPAHWKDIHQNCLRGQIAKNEEDSFLRADGHMEWLRWEIRPWHKSSGEIGGIIMFTEVITERKKGEQAIRESEERYRALVDNATEALVVLDFKKGHFISVSESAERLYGWSKAELLRMGPSDISPEYQPDGRLSADKVIEKIGEAIVGGKPFYEWTYRHQSGHLIPCEVRLVRLPSDKDLLIRGSIVDISERKKSEAEKEMVRYMLRERVKELTTLYKTAQILQEKNLSIQEALNQVTFILIEGWQYPEIAAAKMVYGDEVFMTDNYKNTQWKQDISFITSNDTQCSIEVVYLQKKNNEAEGPFLAEERNLINMLGEMIRLYINRRCESEALQQSEANLKTIFDTTETIYAMTNKKLQIISFNHAAIAFARQELGIINPEDINLRSYFRNDRMDILNLKIPEALQGNPIYYEADYLQPDGSVHWYDVRLNPIKDEEQQLIGLLLSMENITERKIQEKSAHNQIQLLQELSFIISHELRHEYVKLQGIINLLVDLDNVEEEIKIMVNNSSDIFEKLNESIFKLNDKINLSQQDKHLSS